MIEQNSIFTVSRLNAEVRLLLEHNMGMIWLIGEISNFSIPSSGHWYFTLKDKQAQVRCAMFRGNNRSVSFKPSNGDLVLVCARISLYEARGDFQIIVDSMQPEGDGLLKQQFEQLKNRLATEGLFDSLHKLPLPLHAKSIGIITSKTGAALHDILQVLKRRDPSLAVIIYPTQVQGKEAAMQIAQSIELANARDECDVLIIGRGGGSLEDLWSFNEEVVARAIAASHIPTISAVGHEVDVTISDYVADVRAPTPSAAAELVSQDLAFKEQQLSTKFSALQRTMDNILTSQKTRLTEAQHSLSLLHPRTKLQQQAQRFDELERRLHQGILNLVKDKKNQLEKARSKLKQYQPSEKISALQTQLSFLFQRLQGAINSQIRQSEHALSLKMETLNAVSPLATLNRGYSISQDENNKVLRSTTQINKGQPLITVLADGKIYSIVERSKQD